MVEYKDFMNTRNSLPTRTTKVRRNHPKQRFQKEGGGEKNYADTTAVRSSRHKDKREASPPTSAPSRKGYERVPTNWMKLVRQPRPDEAGRGRAQARQTRTSPIPTEHRATRAHHSSHAAKPDQPASRPPTTTTATAYNSTSRSTDSIVPLRARSLVLIFVSRKT
ncbi:hypothetical protein K523DRAFT_402733 [Schizophyllum commune Tattone D]|nr:hypothetical protein K523DRAFT_402733 [Schizophyllum commune Tattone D]